MRNIEKTTFILVSAWTTDTFSRTRRGGVGYVPEARTIARIPDFSAAGRSGHLE